MSMPRIRAALAASAIACAALASLPAAEATTPQLLSSSLDMRNDGTWAATLTLTFNTPVEALLSEQDALGKIQVKAAAPPSHAQLGPATGAAMQSDGSTVKVFFTPEGEERIRLITESFSSLYISELALWSSDDGTPLAKVGEPGHTTKFDRLSWSHTDRSAPPKVAQAGLDREGRTLAIVTDESLAFGRYLSEGHSFGAAYLDLGTLDLTSNSTKFHVRDGPSASEGVTMGVSNNPSAHRSPVHELRFVLSAAQMDAVSSFGDPHLYIDAGAFRGVGSNFNVDSELNLEPNEAVVKRINDLPRLVFAALDPDTGGVFFEFDETVTRGSGSFYIRDSGSGSYDARVDVRGDLSVSGTGGSAALTGAQLTQVLEMDAPYIHLEGGAVRDSSGGENFKKVRYLSGFNQPPVLADSLEVSSDNAARNAHNASGTEYGLVRPGDIVTLQLRADGDGARIVLASATVAGEAAQVSVDSGGLALTASLAVPAGAPDGPLQFSITATSESGLSSSFGPPDLTGANLRVDDTAPEFTRADLNGPTSLLIFYSEAVALPDLGYTVTVDGTVINPPSGPQPALTVYGDGTHVILLSWTGVEMTIPSNTVAGSVVSFTAPQVTDLAGNLDPSHPPRTLPLQAGADVPDSVDLGVECKIHLGFGTLYRNIAFGTTCTAVSIGVSAFNPDSETEATFPDHPVVVEPSSPAMPTVTYPAEVSARMGAAKPDTLDISLVTGDLSEELGGLISNAAEFSAAHPGVADSPVLAWHVGSLDGDISFDRPVLLQFQPGTLSGASVITISADGTSMLVSGCSSPVSEGDTAAQLRAKVSGSGDLVDPDACVEAGSDRIWTLHYSYFVVSTPLSGGGECDDCTPPTLGYDGSGNALVRGGFVYNGLASDVEHFFTPYPLIEAEVGRQNTAVLKIYEDMGPENVSHASLAFGLRSGQSASESLAVINYDISFDGSGTVSVIDPRGAIDPGTLRAAHGEVPCADGSELRCLEVSISHMFRAPLDFDIVATDVWDFERNSWQNYFNHGVRVSGEPLDRQPGAEVNGGALVLYPISAGSSNTDVMADSEGRLYKLASDGLYRQLANQSHLYHQIDESMYTSSGVPMQGYDRSDPQFRGYLLAQAEAAARLLESMTPRSYDVDPGPVATPEPPAPRDIGPDLAAERLRAALLFEELFGYQDINGQD